MRPLLDGYWTAESHDFLMGSGTSEPVEGFSPRQNLKVDRTRMKKTDGGFKGIEARKAQTEADCGKCVIGIDESNPLLSVSEAPSG